MNIVIYTNILTPYRKYFYDLINIECKKNGDNFNLIVMANTEKGRNWNYDDFKSDYTTLLSAITINIKDINIHYNKELKSKLEILKPDIVICAGSYLCPGTWTIANLKEKLKYKCIYWSESHLNEKRNYNSIKIKIRELIRNKFYKKYDGFLYAGEMSKRFINKYALKDTKYFFLPNLIENKIYMQALGLRENKIVEIKKKYNIEKEKYIFICPARLIPVKGICEFLEIIKNSTLKDKFIILIAGDGELRSKINNIAKKFKINIYFMGFLNQIKLVELYAISDCFLLTSLSDANPLTCIEALWSGLPLFISNHCGNYPEVIVQGENGYVFNYNNKDEVLKMFEEVITKSELWKENAKNKSLEIAQKIYNPFVAVKRLLEELKTLKRGKN